MEHDMPYTLSPVTDLLGEPADTWEHGPGGGVRYAYPNGYGLSVICTPSSYGGPSGLFEIAVLTHHEGSWVLCYDTYLHDEDLPGWLTAEQVQGYAEQVRNLPHLAHSK